MNQINSQGVAYINNSFCPIEEAKISVLDWGLLRSDATYDVVHVWDGYFFRLNDHIERFYASAEKLRLEIPYQPHELIIILAECVKRSKFKNSYVEMSITRGIPEIGSRDPRRNKNTFFAFAIPFVWILNSNNWRYGLRASISSFKRIHFSSVDPHIKNYHWLDFTRGLLEAFEYGAETTILSDMNNNITEGPGFNIFCVLEDVLCTPNTNILEGITRKTVIEIATEIAVPVQIRNISTIDFLTSKEIFITSTAGGIMPICQVDNIVINHGKPGSITTSINELYWSKKSKGWHGTKISDILKY